MDASKLRRLPILGIFFALLLMLQAGAGRGSGMGLPSDNSYAPGMIVVGLEPGAHSFCGHPIGAQPAAVFEGYCDFIENRPNTAARADLAEADVLIVPVPVGQEILAVERARKQAGVAFAELDRRASADERRQARLALINDPDFARQWGVEKIGAPFAWSYTGEGPRVLVAVLDSGIQLNHPDLVGRIWTNPGEIAFNYSDDDHNGKVDDLRGWHFYHRCASTGCTAGEDANVSDDYGHGTLISGVIAANSNNAIGVAGLAPNSLILPVKVLDQYGNGWYSDIAAGIIYATNQGARVINLSLGGDDDSALLRSAVDYARARGVLVVAAAGNCGDDGINCNSAINYPAAYDPVLAVAASDRDDLRAAFSDYGPQMDLTAPGVDIYSTWNYSNYLARSGTSLAAPYVSGVAALVWARFPDLSLSELETLLYETVIDLAGPGKDVYTGWGRVSAARVFARLLALPDLWVDCRSSHNAWPGQSVSLYITYANLGWGEVQGGEVSGVLTQTGSTLQTAKISLGTLAPGGGPQTARLEVNIPAGGGSFDFSLTATPLSPDPVPGNNQAHCRLDPPLHYFVPVAGR